MTRPEGGDEDAAELAGRAPGFKGEDEVVRLLLDAGADPHAGGPNAVETARVFGQTGYLDMFCSYRPTVGWRP